MAEKLIKKKVLVIEDTASVRDFMVESLRTAGFECREAHDGSAGVELAKVFLPDIILCDVEMPVMGGYEVFRRVSENPQNCKIPFIFVTGNDSRDDLRKGMASGADDYLTKPFTIKELLESVNARLGKMNLRDQEMKDHVKDIKKSLIERVFRDRVTGLPSRQMMLKRFREIAKSGSVPSAAVLNIGINNLGYISEAFGPRCRDYVVKTTSQRLKRCFDLEAELFWGEHDSFDVLIPHLAEQEKLESLMKKIIKNLDDPFQFESHHFRKSVSIGCSFYTAKAGYAETTMDHAETARRYALKEGGKGYGFYLSGMQKSVQDRLTMENCLFKALERKEFILNFQPQVDIRTNQIRGVEALIRWKSDELGMVSPLHFIPLAEKSGLIVPIGEWVLNESARQLRKWQDAGAKLSMAVNISGRQLEAGDLVEKVESTLEQSGIPPETLELEITESLLVKNTDSVIAQMKALKDRGVMIAIDDFGTGYSALGSLKKFPFDTLKIDRSFIRDLTTHSSDTEIVSAIVKIAQTLKLKTVAEGVETPDQLDCLKNIACDEYQGFLFSKPVPDVEIMPFMSKNS